MIANDSSIVLLEWLTKVLDLPHNCPGLNEGQLLDLAWKLAQRIDKNHFDGIPPELQDQDSAFSCLLTLTCRYLAERDFKKLNCQSQRQILAQRDISELLALLLFTSVNSDFKQEAVSAVLELSQQSQVEIMHIIMRVDSLCHSVLELKKIVEKIEGIQQQNDLIRNKIKQQQEEIQRQLADIEEIQSWNVFLARQNCQYIEQKNTAFKELQINQIEEFTNICSQIKENNSELSRSLQELIADRSIVAQEHKQLKKSLKKKGQKIQSQMRQLQDWKIKCKQLNNEFWLKQPIVEQIEGISSLPLQDCTNRLNINGPRVNEKPKLPTDRTMCSNRQEQLEQSFENRQNLHSLLSLCDLQKQQIQAHQQIAALKYLNEVEIAQKKVLNKKIAKIWDCHKKFQASYKQTIIIKD